jgi:hypothetical protein
MPAKEIKELRQAGKLEEALVLAQAELDADPENIWSKRNICWVYYDFLKQNVKHEKLKEFCHYLEEIHHLQMPEDETILFEQLAWQIGKMGFVLTKLDAPNHDAAIFLFEKVRAFSFPKPTESYTMLFKALHRCLKDTPVYHQFADWWDFSNFMSSDFEKEKLPNGREVMSIVEQAYITYAKHLLPQKNSEHPIEKSKILAFINKLSELSEQYPNYSYPPYFQAKLLLATGDKENTLSALLPFAKKRKNDFWVWDLISETLADEKDKSFSCLCRALTCQSPPEMMLNIRLKMARLLIEKKLYTEAKTEIEIVLKVREVHNFRLPFEIILWQVEEWYENFQSQENNLEFYKQHLKEAEEILYADSPEELVIVEFVNPEKKMLNFIADETKYGFFKYERFLQDVNIGDVLKIRIQNGSCGGIYHILSASKTSNPEFANHFTKVVKGAVKIAEGREFGFIENIFINPGLVKKYKLSDGQTFEGKAIKSYNKEKKTWGWKLI